MLVVWVSFASGRVYRYGLNREHIAVGDTHGDRCQMTSGLIYSRKKERQINNMLVRLLFKIITKNIQFNNYINNNNNYYLYHVIYRLTFNGEYTQSSENNQQF